MIYAAIDLKSFYASVECIERNLDPLTTNLVVANASKTEKTICLAVSPSLKQYGIGGRARLFEVVSKVNELNRKRYSNNSSYDDLVLKAHPDYKIDYIIASPRMALYLEYSTKIYEIYLKYVSKEDIHVYSIDEVFIDATSYLKAHNMSPRAFVAMIIQDIYQTTHITATAGIGSNLYLCKVAMDIVSKKVKAGKDGLRIAQLDIHRYRRYLWDHQPLTDFWRIGKGIMKRLNHIGLYTMGDIASFSLENEDKLYDILGVNAELVIDHAWGYEVVTIKDIQAYKPENTSIGSGQVLSCPYSHEDGLLIVKEMVESLCLTLTSKQVRCKDITIVIGYDKDNVAFDTMIDRYGRTIPKHAHGIIHLDRYTCLYNVMIEPIITWYHSNVSKTMTIRRINISMNNVITKEEASKKVYYKQLDLFSEEVEEIDTSKEEALQEAILAIKNKYGKDSVLKVMNLQEKSTAIERNNTIGGHKAK